MFLDISRPAQEEPRQFPYGPSAAEAWRAWRLESCIERHGGHDWRLILDCGSADLGCAHCPAGSDDIFWDASECLTAEIPVGVEVVTHRYAGGPWGPEEYDLWVHLTPRS